LGRGTSSTVAVALVAAGIALGLGQLGILDPLEEAAVDARFEVRGQVAAPETVAVVAIDDDTPAQLGESYPLPRSRHAQAIDRLRQAGARTIVYDIAFEDPKRTAEDRALVVAIRRAGNVVLATARVAADGSGTVRFLGEHGDVRDIEAVSGYDGIEKPVTRRVPGSFRGVPSLSVAATRQAGGKVDRGWLDDNELWVGYPGGAGTIETVSFTDLARNRVRPDTLEDRVVVVGSAVSSDGDRHPTSAPGDELMPGAEIHAAAIASLLSGSPLRAAPWWALALLVAACVTGGAVAGRRIASPIGVAALAGALAAIAVASQMLFDHDLILPVGPPLFGLLLAAAGSAAVSSREVVRERDRLRRDFAAFDATAVGSVLRGASAAGGPAAEQIVSGYRLESLIGRGSTGVVYRATELAGQAPAAVKILQPHLADDPVFRKRFEREAALSAAVSHPHVLPVHASGDDDGVLFIAMRLVEGSDASAFVKEAGPLDAARAVEIVEATAGALDAAHAAGLVHRDVKPSNVLLDSEDGAVYLADFGLARHVEGGTLTADGTAVGTLAFAAPEQLRGESPGSAADVYALAGLFYFLVTGQVPYPREDAAAVIAAHLSTTPPCLGGELAIFDEALARGLAKHPADRWPSAGGFAHALRRALDG
jgi:CHASE2 domain-containing sensor protein